MIRQASNSIQVENCWLSEMDYYPSARLWDVEQGEEIHEFPSGEIGGIIGLWDNRGFSPCGSYLVCGYAQTEEAICLWDVEQKEILTTLPLRYASTFAYSLCGTYLACGGEGAAGILLWNLKRSEVHKRLSLPDGCRATHALTFSSCGQYLAFGAAWEPNLEKVPICLWEGRNRQAHYHTLGAPNGCAGSCLFVG